MPWGTSPWGLGPWGGGAPVIDLVVTPWGGGIVDVLGGDVITIGGSNFADPVLIEVLFGGNVVGTCYVFDPRYDVSASRIYCGTPALAQGTYDVRVTTDAGTSTLVGALTYEPIADQLKVERVRISLARVWSAGPLVLRGGV